MSLGWEKLSRWAMMSSEERDASYNSNAAVPDAADQLARRNASSEAFRRQFDKGLDVAYGPAPRQCWDIYSGASAEAPCLAFIHGGFWQRNSKADFACYAAGLIEHGWSVAMVGHTLAPDATLTQIVGEIGQALDWLGENGAAHGVAAGPVVLCGWSSGAHLAVMNLDHPRIAAGFAISGVYELGGLRDTSFNVNIKLTDQELATLSPLRLPVSSKPLAISYGTRELAPLVHDSRALHEKRSAAHVPGPLVPIAGADHFSILNEFSAADGQLVACARGLLPG